MLKNNTFQGTPTEWRSLLEPVAEKSDSRLHDRQSNVLKDFTVITGWPVILNQRK